MITEKSIRKRELSNDCESSEFLYEKFEQEKVRIETSDEFEFELNVTITMIVTQTITDLGQEMIYLLILNLISIDSFELLVFELFIQEQICLFTYPTCRVGDKE